LKLFNLLLKSSPESLIWESKVSGVTVQVWEKEDRRELRFGNHIMQSVISKIRPDMLVLPYSRKISSAYRPWRRQHCPLDAP